MSVTETRITPRPPPAAPRRIRRSRMWRSWTIAWAGTAAIGVGNGALREVLFGDLGTESAGQVSTVTLLAFLALYMRWLEGRQPIPSSKSALQIGVVWALLTIVFEFGFGLFITKDSFADLVRAYDITDGRIWALVPLWMFVGPEVVRRARRGADVDR